MSVRSRERDTLARRTETHAPSRCRQSDWPITHCRPPRADRPLCQDDTDTVRSSSNHAEAYVDSQLMYSFGEVLPKDPPTTLPLSPVNTKHLSLRRLVTISDLASYRKLSQTLPAAELNYVRTRVRAGEPDVVSQLFYCGAPVDGGFAKVSGLRDNGVGYTWACVKTTWWERGGPPYGVISGHGRTQPKPAPGQAAKGLPLEVGVAVLRCANLHGVVS